MEVISNQEKRVVPGGLDRIGSTDKYCSGDGTFVKDNVIFSSIVGTTHVKSQEGSSNILYVEPIRFQAVPEVNDIVLARVVSVSLRTSYVRILCVNGIPVSTAFKGTIKKEHVRAFEIDKVVMYKSFRIGDIVRARVLSRGDKRSYYLATDRNDLGVVLATSTSGTVMVPVSWELMQDPETNAVEYRKVAKMLSDEEVKEIKRQQELDALVN